jgi:streptomycin 6-kinase
MAHGKTLNLPEAFLKNLQDMHPDAAQWLETLPVVLQTLEQRWGIRIFTETTRLPRLSYNLVMFAEGRDNTPYVLKMSPPGDEFTREVIAIRYYNGDGMARVVQADETLAAVLLERLEPGVSLWDTPPDDAKRDEKATRIIATLMQRLWRPVSEPHGLRTLESWTEALAAYEGSEIPKPYVDKAKGLLKELLPTQHPVLLHGDLHHDNILSATREPYLAIDPKGLVGTKAYDLTPALMNPDAPTLGKHPALAKILERRISIFSEMLTIDRKEIAAWGFTQLMLGSIWSIEDHGEPWESGSFAEAFATLL